MKTYGAKKNHYQTGKVELPQVKYKCGNLNRGRALEKQRTKNARKTARQNSRMNIITLLKDD